MPRTEHVPRAQEGRRDAALANARLSRLAHGDVGLHHRSGLRHADVDEMLDARSARRHERGIDRGQVHRAEARRLGRAGMRRADEMDQRVRRRELVRERPGLERVSHNGFGAGGNVLHALPPSQGPHAVPAAEQDRCQGPAHIAGRSGDEDAAPRHYLRFFARLAAAFFLRGFAVATTEPVLATAERPVLEHDHHVVHHEVVDVAGSHLRRAHAQDIALLQHVGVDEHHVSIPARDRGAVLVRLRPRAEDPRFEVDARRDSAEDGLAVDLQPLAHRHAERLEEEQRELAAVDRRAAKGEGLLPADEGRVVLDAGFALAQRRLLVANHVPEPLPDVGDDGEVQCHCCCLLLSFRWNCELSHPARRLRLRALGPDQEREPVRPQ